MRANVIKKLALTHASAILIDSSDLNCEPQFAPGLKGYTGFGGVLSIGLPPFLTLSELPA